MKYDVCASGFCASAFLSHRRDIHSHYRQSLENGSVQRLRYTFMTRDDKTRTCCPGLASARGCIRKFIHTRTSLQFMQHSSCCHGNLSLSSREYHTGPTSNKHKCTRSKLHLRHPHALISREKNTLCQKGTFRASLERKKKS